MRDGLPKRARATECGILNLDILSGQGTHWTCWFKHERVCYYFDSFGLPPPLEFYRYIRCECIHSTYQIQRVGDVVCGHLCIVILYHPAVQRLSFHDALINVSQHIWW